MFNLKKFTILGLCLCVVVVTAGCEPLRKKFTRKKKKTQKEEVMPVLEPIDYPARGEDPVQEYEYHYSLFRVWHQDLMAAITEDRASASRKRSSMQGMLKQLEDMKPYLSGEPKIQLEKIQGEVERVEQQLNQPEQFQNYSALVNQLRSIEKKFINLLKPEAVKDSVVMPPS